MLCNRPGFLQIELFEFRWSTTRVCRPSALYVKFGFKRVGRGDARKEDLLCFLSSPG